MSDPFVSIIIPCFNSEPFVERAIESALRQTLTDFEIILVDNRSTDKTYEILTSWQSRFPKKIKVFQEGKQGVSSARNKGISESRGEWIQFLDSDDELHPEKIARQLALAKKHHAGLVAGSYTTKYRRELRKIRVYPEAWSGLILSRLGITSANLWRRGWLDKVGWFLESQKTSEEYELMFRLLQASVPWVWDDAFNTVKHERPESLGKSADQKKSAQIWRSIFDLRLAIREYLAGQDMFAGKIKRNWEKYMHNHLEYLKYTNPEVYNYYRPLSKHDLPFLLAIRPVVIRKLRILWN